MRRPVSGNARCVGSTSPLWRIGILLVAVGVFSWWEMPLSAQDLGGVSGTRDFLTGDDLKGEGQVIPGLGKEEVGVRLAAFEADPGIDEGIKDLLRPKYMEALELAAEAEGYAARARIYLDARHAAPGEITSLRKRMGELPAVERVRREAEAEHAAQAAGESLEVLRANLGRIEKERAAVTGELAKVRDRPMEISQSLPVAREGLAAVRAALASEELVSDSASPGRMAERLLQEVREAKLVAELAMLEEERSSHEVREELLRLRGDWLVRRLENAAARLEVAQAAADRERERILSRIAAVAREALAQASESDTRVEMLASEVLALVEQSERVALDVKVTWDEQGQLAGRRSALAREDRLIRAQLKLGRAGGEMAQWLFEFRQRLPRRQGLLLKTKKLYHSIGEARLEALAVEEARLQNEALEASFGVSLSPRVASLLASRKELLEKLDDQYTDFVRALGELAVDGGLYLDEVSVIRGYLDEELFWVRSSPVAGLATLRDLPGGAHALFGRDTLREVGSELVAGVKGAPVWLALAWILLAGLVLMRRRVGRALEATGVRIRRISTDRYSFTALAFLWTLALALPVPLFLFLLGVLLGMTPDSGRWLSGMGRGLVICSLVALPVVFMFTVCRPSGLGDAHFRWRKELLGRLRWASAWFAVLYLSAYLVLRLSFTDEGGVYFDSVGRMSFILAQAGIAVLLWKLFRRRKDGLLTRFMEERPGSLVSGLHGVGLAVIVGWPLGLIVLACFGYLFTAQILSFELVLSGVIIQAGVIGYWMTLRWFMIRERRLALAAAIEERESRRAAAKSRGSEREEIDGSRGSEEVVSVEIEEEKIDLSSIGDQTRYLLRSVFLVGAVIAVGMFWSRTVPVISALDGVRSPVGPSLLDLVEIMLVIFVTSMASRNLPGLLELAVLGSMGIDAGTRTAIVTLSRYLVIAAGVVFVFHILSVDWAKFGWIAAALSVGLGFGLQEVVANFVCGLVILFERPIRVGDIVTVEGMTGTVSRIRMRATTIINWDRQEFVVPNKTFVTGTILNWTLSNAINRIIVAVGVAYGSDTDRARKILLEVASDHPLVLEDPAPLASFEEFADSSLTLRLRVYLPNLDDRIKTLTELHAEIDRRFADAGIEIAFPQRDLHLRGWLPPAPEDLGRPEEPSRV